MRFVLALTLWIACGAAHAQQNVISRFAGGGLPVTPAAALKTAIGAPQRVATDAAGNFYFASFSSIFRVDRAGVLTHLAGTGVPGYSGDHGLASNAQLMSPYGMAIDGAGNVFISDWAAHTVRRISTDGTINTVAGTGTAGYSGDGKAAALAQLNRPEGLALDSTGNLYIADEENNRIRKVTADGTISTVAGVAGTCGYRAPDTGDGGPAANASVCGASDVAVDGKGNLYIAQYASIRKVDAQGIISTLAGGDPATSPLKDAQAIALDNSGNIYIADSGNYRIHQLRPDRVLSTVAGNGSYYSGPSAADGVAALAASLFNPTGVAVDHGGNILFVDGHYKIWQCAPLAGTITGVAGNGERSFSGDGGPATQAQLDHPTGIALDPTGNLYIADFFNDRVRKVAPGGVITTVAGSGVAGYSGDGGDARSAQLFRPIAVALDATGNLYIADLLNNRIRKVSPAGIISTVAGNGTAGYSGDNGPAANAQLNWPSALAVDVQGNLYVADNRNNVVRKVDSRGVVTTFAGKSGLGMSGEGIPATLAQLDAPTGLAFDGAGNLYIAASVIRKVTPDGTMTTVPQQTAYELQQIAAGKAGDLYVATSRGYRVVKIAVDGTASTLAGNWTTGYSGDGGPATSAAMHMPFGVAVDQAGKVYVSDEFNDVIRVIEAAPAAPAGPAIEAVANVASNVTGPVAPGEMVVIYGKGVGPATIAMAQPDSSGSFPNAVAGTSVRFNGQPAPMIYSLATQAAAVVPYGLTGATAQVAVEYQGQTGAAVTISLAPSVPALFTLNGSGKGPAAAVNQDGAINGSDHPAPAGSIVILFATGEGQTSPAGVDGKPAAAPLPNPVLPVEVSIGGRLARVLYAGGAPGEVAGVMQLNVEVPAGVGPGSVPVVLQVGNASSPLGVTLAVSN